MSHMLSSKHGHMAARDKPVDERRVGNKLTGRQTFGQQRWFEQRHFGNLNYARSADFLNDEYEHNNI